MKPEYWLDRKLARGASRDARLLYIGLWNYADEHGRLHGDPAVIKGQVFPYDDIAVTPLIEELEALGRVQAYEFEGDPFLFLPMLAKHQRLEPAKAKSRLPDPPDPSAEPCVSRSQKDSEKTVAESEPIAAVPEPIVVQQVAGGRGQVARSMEQVAGGMARAGQNSGNAQTLIAEWIDHTRAKPPQRIVGQVAKILGELLTECQPYDVVRRGLAEWDAKNLHPSVLPSIVYDVAKGPPKTVNKATQRINENLALVQRLQEQERGA